MGTLSFVAKLDRSWIEQEGPTTCDWHVKWGGSSLVRYPVGFDAPGR